MFDLSFAECDLCAFAAGAQFYDLLQREDRQSLKRGNMLSSFLLWIDNPTKFRSEWDPQMELEPEVWWSDLAPLDPEFSKISSLQEIACVVLRFRISTAGLERQFKGLKSIRTKVRNRLSHSKGDELTKIYWYYKSLEVEEKSRRPARLTSQEPINRECEEDVQRLHDDDGDGADVEQLDDSEEEEEDSDIGSTEDDDASGSLHDECS